MKADWAILDVTEKLSFVLRSLYRSFGFERYRMSKFEDYDLYARNKEFLVSENLITFTDLTGKLKALKPDVTLSIIKNHRDPENGVLKLCYDEKVYRVSKNGGEFREIPQSGLECIGAVDEECIAEVLTLAVKSLAVQGRRFVLSVSDLDVLSGFVQYATEDPETGKALLKCIGEKNVHGIEEIGEKAGLPKEATEKLKAMISLPGTLSQAMDELETLSEGTPAAKELARLKRILALVPETYRASIEADFSVVGNTSYYNGVTFKGYVEGVPESVLSGGQYDGLMKKLGRKSKAVGFAVYLDTLERIGEPEADPEAIEAEKAFSELSLGERK